MAGEAAVLVLLAVLLSSNRGVAVGTTEEVEVLTFQKDRVASSVTEAWYRGALDPSRRLSSVTLCGRVYLFTLHAWATFFMLTTDDREMHILEGDIWVEKVRPVFARNWNFQLLKEKLWVFRWHHICFTYDHAQEVISTYVDGRLNNQQQYRVGRTMAGSAARLGQGATPERSLSGDLTQVNVWDRALGGAEVRRMAACEEDTQGNYVSWREGWTLHNVTSRSLPLAQLCQHQFVSKYFSFPSVSFATARYLCPALGSGLPNATDKNEMMTILETVQYDTCSLYYWLPITDMDYEGVWKIGKFPVEGNILWNSQEPNGLEYENCAVLVRLRQGVSDVDCHSGVRCAVCSFSDSQKFSLQGTCEEEVRNIYFTAFQPRLGSLEFVGYGSYSIQWTEGVWTWQDTVTNLTMAHMEEDTQHYPMGRRWWRLLHPVCGQQPGGLRQLLLSPCAFDQFTCNDATCIPLRFRCDLKYDCSDNSDELECHLVAFPRDYQKHLPPNPGGDIDTSLPVTLAVKLDSLAVRTVGMEMEVSYRLQVSWMDSRLLFQNLKQGDSLNMLPMATVTLLWTPQIAFVNTISSQHTLTDSDATMWVTRRSSPVGRNGSAAAEVEVFSGVDNPVWASRKYGTVFLCHMDLALYPFDSQQCFMRFRLDSATKTFVVVDLNASTVANSANTNLVEYEVGPVTLVEGEGGGQYSEVRVLVPLRRNSGYAVLNIYLPTLVLLVVSYLTLFFRPPVFEVRMMAALTVQLVIATLFSQVSSTLPKTSYFKMVDVWLIFCICLTFLTIVFHALVDNIVNAEEEVPPPPPARPGAIDGWVAKGGKRRGRGGGGAKKGARVVFVTQVAVPLVFVLFNFCYWVYIFIFGTSP